MLTVLKSWNILAKEQQPIEQTIKAPPKFQAQVVLFCDAAVTFNCQDETRSSKLQADASTGAGQKLQLQLWRKTVL